MRDFIGREKIGQRIAIVFKKRLSLFGFDHVDTQTGGFHKSLRARRRKLLGEIADDHAHREHHAKIHDRGIF